jgi:hypothetical protein
MASAKNENPSTAKPKPNTPPNVPVNAGHSTPISKLRIVPVTTPTANSATNTRVQRWASVRYNLSPVRRYSHSTNRMIARKAIPKHTSGICTANDSACICRACSKYSCVPGGSGGGTEVRIAAFVVLRSLARCPDDSAARSG